ncbi:hypothetical protein C8T65DRAFT_783996 [Cerioporus squamosus]|nr:hypothetical protein C8T65DRAFT_783996 [Cerioporus squamosus]
MIFPCQLETSVCLQVRSLAIHRGYREALLHSRHCTNLQGLSTNTYQRQLWRPQCDSSGQSAMDCSRRTRTEFTGGRASTRSSCPLASPRDHVLFSSQEKLAPLVIAPLTITCAVVRGT